MDRRNFISGLVAAAAGFSILPPATTYNRIWRAKRWVMNPDWVWAPWNMEVTNCWNPDGSSWGMETLRYCMSKTSEGDNRYIRENGVWKHVPKFIEV